MNTTLPPAFRYGMVQLYQPMNAVVEALMMAAWGLASNTKAPPRALSICVRCVCMMPLGTPVVPDDRAIIDVSWLKIGIGSKSSV